MAEIITDGSQKELKKYQIKQLKEFLEQEDLI